MASPAMAQAVAMPEILERIFNSMETDHRALLAAARVNKLWFDCATNSLWKHASHNALADIPKDRQQIYAAKMERVNVGSFGGKFHKFSHDLSFDKLMFAEMGSIHASRQGTEFHLQQYLRPRLETLHFYGGQLVGDMQATCWRLKKIWIASPGSQVSSEMMFDFISGCKSLESVTLSKETGNLTSDQLLHDLASRPNLTKLGLERSLEPALISDIAEASSGHPFPALRSLRITKPLPSASGVLLGELLPSITTIDLSFQDSQNDILGSMASIRDLRHIKFTFGNEAKLFPGQLLSLKSHRNLESLNLKPTKGGKIDATGFTDTDFGQLSAQLPNLKYLWFEVQGDLTTASLASLSNQCQTIGQIDPRQTFDWDVLLVLQDPRSFIPETPRELIRGGIPYNSQEPSKMAIIAKNRMPTFELVAFDWVQYDVSTHESTPRPFPESLPPSLPPRRRRPVKKRQATSEGPVYSTRRIPDNCPHCSKHTQA
ncbi:unnamed protein product [Clonostachys solani]|uniref:F-box domain-containing protein n=1 Tax=Clonostachys solani TaxID=160281 RepID=A0A9N9ZLU3_9HYPO|nr:unnamed protein product [Clonostachys solani]